MRVCPDCLNRTPRAECATPRCAGTATLALGTDRRCGTLIADRFVVLDVLGRGGMGVVYRAWQQSTRRQVALKLLRGDLAGENAVQRFLREAEVTAGLTCPHTVTVHDFGATADGDLYIAMECIEGDTLDALLRRGRMGPERALGLIDQIGLALEEAHEKGLVHRDLKPANIMVQRVGRDREFARVLDFGVVRLLGEGHTLTERGAGPGTPEYMSPEQAQGQPVGPASDQYALGLLLYEMLTGERPFVGDSTLEVLMQHIGAPPPRLIDHPAFADAADLDAVVQRMLAKAPGDRYPDVSVVRRALGALRLDEVGVVAPTDRAPDRALALAETRESDDAVPAAADTHADPPAKRLFLNVSGFGCAIQIGVVAAAVALFVLRPTAAPEASLDDYTFGEMQGAQARFRGAATPAAEAPSRPMEAPSRPVFYGFSVVRFDVAPRAARATVPALRVYTHAPGQPLQRVAGVVTAHAGGAFRVEGDGRTFFGDEPGPRRVHLVLGIPGVDRASGRLEPVARLLGGVWATHDLDYRGDAPP